MSSRLGTGNKTMYFLYNDDLTSGVKSAGNIIQYHSFDSTYTNSVGNATTDLWESKEIDFNNPAADAFIYNVKITYKSDGASNVNVSFIGNDGDGSTTYPTNYSSTVLPDTTNKFHTIEVKSTGGTVKCKTFKIKVVAGSSAISDSFVITDLTIVYRDKRVR